MPPIPPITANRVPITKRSKRCTLCKISHPRSAPTASCFDKSALTLLVETEGIYLSPALFLALPIFNAKRSISLYSLPIHTSSLGVGVIAATIDDTVTIKVIKPIIFEIASIIIPRLLLVLVQPYPNN